MGRPKGTAKYVGERSSFNVLLPVSFIKEIDRLAKESRPRKSRAHIATELIQMGLLYRKVSVITAPMIERALPGEDLWSGFVSFINRELNELANQCPELFEGENHDSETGAGSSGENHSASEQGGSEAARRAA